MDIYRNFRLLELLRWAVKMTAIVLSVSVRRSDGALRLFQRALPTNSEPSCSWLLLGLVLHLEDLGECRLKHRVFNHELLAAVIENLPDDLTELGHVTFPQLRVHRYPTALHSHRRSARQPSPQQFSFGETAAGCGLVRI